MPSKLTTGERLPDVRSNILNSIACIHPIECSSQIMALWAESAQSNACRGKLDVADWSEELLSASPYVLITTRSQHAAIRRYFQRIYLQRYWLNRSQCCQWSARGSDLETFYLRVWMLKGSGANPRVCSPKFYCVVVASCSQDNLEQISLYRVVNVLLSLPKPG